MRRASSGMVCGLAGLVAAGLLLSSPAPTRAQLADASSLPPEAVRQIEAILAEKAQRTPAQQKVSSNLLRELRVRRGDAPMAAAALRRSALVSPDGMADVDIAADVTPDLLARIGAAGGSLVSSVARYGAVRARIPLAALESIAALDEVRVIAPAAGVLAAGGRLAADDVAAAKVDTTAGDVAHRAALARQFYGVDGTGIVVGVLADGADSRLARLGTGDLPAVTVLTGQAGSGDRGTALLEIVHDLAPGASLFFATTGSGQAQFAANLLALCAAGARVIVGDAVYDDEAAFQDGPAAQAVNAATASGCFYFAAAGDLGNKTDGTSGVWEGDFVASTPLGTLGTTHNFGGVNSNQIAQDAGRTFTLQWSDPWGQSANDYDLFLLDASMTQVLEESTNTQNGLQNPFESITTDFIETNRRLVVVRFTGAARYLRLALHGGRLAISTPGRIAGHAGAKNAIAVGAVDVAAAQGGSFPSGPLVPVAPYSSDGPRRLFYHPNGTAITPGDVSATGGELVLKPDVAAADCVATSTPGFNPFCGTSAAAAHVAAVAALMLQVDPALTRSSLATAMTTRALDIAAAGPDRDSGAGIVDALGAVGRTHPPFADNPVVARTTLVRPLHVTQLRTRVNALRVRCGLSATAFTDETLAPAATLVKTAHIAELRSALDAANVACGTSAPAYTDPTITAGATTIKAAHINELRAAIVALE